MTLNATAPWHRESFDRFLQTSLPQLLAERLPLAGYHAEPEGEAACRVRFALAAASGDVEVEYPALPCPTEAGLFMLDGQELVVVPTAVHEELDTAEIRCVGKQLYDFIAARLGDAPADLPWDEALARAWVPLDAWIPEFLQQTGQPLHTLNWLDRHTHLRRILILNGERAFAAGQLGRACPFETPEGRQMGRLLSVALGATVQDGRLVVVDDRPEAALGLTAAMVPFLEHSEAARLTMGMNLMRRWLVPPDPEPALAQTGNEPNAPDFWCGRNLLTAFISWDADAYWDGIVLSESCARRLGYPRPLEPGDLLSNRHGYHGTVTRILPDAEMPHLPDGTPVELIDSAIRLHTRMNFGQIRETLMGRIAHAEGTPALVPPFHAPTSDALRQRLTQAGLPADGMETLTLGKDGPSLPNRSLVGWTYWGRANFLAREKMLAATDGTCCVAHSEADYIELREAGTLELLREQFNTTAAEREDAETLAARVAVGPLEQAGPPSPQFAELTRRLAAASIRADLGPERLTFRFAAPEGETIQLAQPMPHPWSRARMLTEVGALSSLPEFAALTQANARLARLLADNTPESLTHKGRADLEAAVKAYFDALLKPEHLRPRACALFAGRAVISVRGDLRHDQVGLPEEIAWTLFGPHVIRELGDTKEVEARTAKAAQTLDMILARSWVVVKHGLREADTTFLAFHPVRQPAPTLSLPPLVCWGLIQTHSPLDIPEVFLPLTEGGQRDAGERLSLLGHLRRHPDRFASLLPSDDALWGLAYLSLTESGKNEIVALVGAEVATPAGTLTKSSLQDALQTVLQRDGLETALTTLERLIRRGFEVARATGASLNPFFGSTVARPPQPDGGDPDAWNAYAESLFAQVSARADYADPDLGPQLLAIKSGAAGSLRHLRFYLGALGMRSDALGNPLPNRVGLPDGWTPDELFASAAGTRETWEQFRVAYARSPRALHDRGFTLLARARQSERPGIVFALAANGEPDPLEDPDTRLYLGLPAKAY